MDLSTFETDQDAAEEGVWCDVGDSRLKVARYGNKKFQRYLQRLVAPYKQIMQKGQMPEETSEKLMIQALSKHVLLGWENLTVDGESVEYSTANAIEILSNERFKDFREIVVSMSQEADLFRKEEVEEVVEK